MIEVIEIVTRCDDADALQALADTLVGRRLGACAHVRGPMTSRYHWDGELVVAQEWELDVVTTDAGCDAVVRALRSGHPYDTPAVVVRRINVEDHYGAWVDAQVAPTGDDPAR